MMELVVDSHRHFGTSRLNPKGLGGGKIPRFIDLAIDYLLDSQASAC